MATNTHSLQQYLEAAAADVPDSQQVRRSMPRTTSLFTSQRYHSHLERCQTFFALAGHLTNLIPTGIQFIRTSLPTPINEPCKLLLHPLLFCVADLAEPGTGSRPEQLWSQALLHEGWVWFQGGHPGPL